MVAVACGAAFDLFECGQALQQRAVRFNMAQRRPALPGAGRGVPDRYRWGAGLRRGGYSDRSSAAGGAAQDHHPNDASGSRGAARWSKSRLRPTWLTTTATRTKPACRPEGADGARHDAEGDGLQTEALCRHERFQPACGRAPWGRLLAWRWSKVPHHHPPSTCQRTGAVQRCWASRADAEDALARRHHAPGDVAAGVHAATRRPGAEAALAFPLLRLRQKVISHSSFSGTRRPSVRVKTGVSRLGRRRGAHLHRFAGVRSQLVCRFIFVRCTAPGLGPAAE